MAGRGFRGFDQQTLAAGAALLGGYAPNIARRMPRVFAPFESKHSSRSRGSSRATNSTNPSPAQAIPGKSYGGRKKLRRRKLKGKKGLNKDVAQIKSKLKELKHHDDATLGTLTHRVTAASTLACLQNVKNSQVLGGISTTSMDNTLAKLKFFDPSTPGTLITGDMGGVTYQNNVLFDRVSSSILVRNNYKVDCAVKIYLCCIKDDSDKSPTDLWTDGVADGGNATSKDDINQFPSDYDVVNDVWRLKLLQNRKLSPGQSCSASHAERMIEYSTSTVDAQTQKYQREYKSFVFMVEIQGTLGHDTVATAEQGYLPAQVDIMMKRSSVVKYNAGANISYIDITNTIDNFTNAGVQSQKPSSGQQSWGLA